MKLLLPGDVKGLQKTTLSPQKIRPSDPFFFQGRNTVTGVCCFVSCTVRNLPVSPKQVCINKTLEANLARRQQLFWQCTFRLARSPLHGPIHGRRRSQAQAMGGAITQRKHTWPYTHPARLVDAVGRELVVQVKPGVQRVRGLLRFSKESAFVEPRDATKKKKARACTSACMTCDAYQS